MMWVPTPFTAGSPSPIRGGWPRLLVLLAALASPLLLGNGSCEGDPAPEPPRRDDDDSGSVDDDDTGPQDDDDSAASERMAAVTFAATLSGEPREPGADDLRLVELLGTFQFIYWDSEDDMLPSCRARYGFEALAELVGPELQPIEGYPGWLQFLHVERQEAAPGEDDCGELRPDEDLGFLLDSTSVTTPSDFSTMALVPVDTLIEAERLIGRSGTSAADIQQTYRGAGFVITHFAFVPPGGWLATEAALADVAVPWGEPSWLPMFVIYREDDEFEDDGMLAGPHFLATLWTLRLGEDGGATEPP